MVASSPPPIILGLKSPDATLPLAGGKGASLARLAAAGLPVPDGFHVTTHAYRRFVDVNQIAGPVLSAAANVRAEDQASLERASQQIKALFTRAQVPEDIAAGILQAYRDLSPGDPPVAVRSSATAEDLPEMSFAGQQETYLNVSGAQAILAAVKRCWASLWTARAIGYRARNGIPPQDVALAVVVQLLVPADAAGILFTANPVTGNRDQMVINAAWGLGEAIVGGHVTPDTVIVNRATREIESYDIADKQAMTVRWKEGTHEEPVAGDRRRQAVLQASQVAELAALGSQIEQLCGQPVDIEWALQGKRLSILQARPITALPEPQPQLDWTLPRAKGQYWRASVVELLPDPLSPLFATLGLPRWSEAMRNMGKPVGLDDLAYLMPENFLVTINDYAYYDYGFRPSQYGKFVLILPKLIRRLLPTAEERWVKQARPQYGAVVAAWEGRDLASIPSTQLVEGAREIVQIAAQHYLTVQSGILPVAGLSEWIFTMFYNRLVKRKGDPDVLTFMVGFDSAPIKAEKSLYDLARWARGIPELAAYLQQSSSPDIAAVYASSTTPILDLEAWHEFCRRFAAHLRRFGHAIYDLDFVKPLPTDDPATLLETLKYFLSDDAQNPYTRQSAAASRREQAMGSIRSRLIGFRLRWFNRLVEWAQRFAPLREDALADVGLGWPVVRRILEEVGKRLVTAKALTTSNDVYWLEFSELEGAARALEAGSSPGDFRDRVAVRRTRWARERQVTPPVVLPVKGGGRFLGIDWTGWMPAKTGQAAGNTIKGIAASPGQVAGRACVILDPGSFSQMRPGEILVARITTPAWTPLFALASGIVTDVGGPLSHSSIVAREYHIPAVLGTGVATERITNGQFITVDGDLGLVTLST